MFLRSSLLEVCYLTPLNIFSKQFQANFHFWLVPYQWWSFLYRKGTALFLIFSFVWRTGSQGFWRQLPLLALDNGFHLSLLPFITVSLFTHVNMDLKNPCFWLKFYIFRSKSRHHLSAEGWPVNWPSLTWAVTPFIGIKIFGPPEKKTPRLTIGSLRDHRLLGGL